MSGSVADRLASLQERIAAAAGRAGRDPADITLVAVSKVHPAEAIAAAHDAGACTFGENYVQEWVGKAEHPRLVGRGLEWSFIGHLQRNKVRHLLGRVALIETVDSVRLAQEIDKRARARGGGFRQAVLLQVDLAGEDSKSGFSPARLRDDLPGLLTLPGLDVRGLMHIPPRRSTPEATRDDHRALRALRDSLATARHPLPELSMGMSSDFEIAIEEGATRVRVGTALFGARVPTAR